MQSVAVRGSNKRCIATCLHLSVCEIATHFLMNFFVSSYFDGNESCSPERMQWAQWLQGLLLAAAETWDLLAGPCWHQSDGCFLSSELRAHFEEGGQCGKAWMALGCTLNIHYWAWEEKQDHLEIWQQESITDISMRTCSIFQPLLKCEGSTGTIVFRILGTDRHGF